MYEKNEEENRVFAQTIEKIQFKRLQAFVWEAFTHRQTRRHNKRTMKGKIIGKKLYCFVWILLHFRRVEKYNKKRGVELHLNVYSCIYLYLSGVLEGKGWARTNSLISSLEF